MTPFPPKQQQRQGCLRDQRWGRCGSRVTQEGKASPGNSQCEALNLPPCREVGLPASAVQSPHHQLPPATSVRGGRKRRPGDEGGGTETAS